MSTAHLIGCMDVLVDGTQAVRNTELSTPLIDALHTGHRDAHDVLSRTLSRVDIRGLRQLHDAFDQFQLDLMSATTELSQVRMLNAYVSSQISHDTYSVVVNKAGPLEWILLQSDIPLRSPGFIRERVKCSGWQNVTNQDGFTEERQMCATIPDWRMGELSDAQAEACRMLSSLAFKATEVGQSLRDAHRIIDAQLENFAKPVQHTNGFTLNQTSYDLIHITPRNRCSIEYTNSSSPALGTLGLLVTTGPSPVKITVEGKFDSVTASLSAPLARGGAMKFAGGLTPFTSSVMFLISTPGGTGDLEAIIIRERSGSN